MKKMTLEAKAIAKAKAIANVSPIFI